MLRSAAAEGVGAATAEGVGAAAADGVGAAAAEGVNKRLQANMQVEQDSKRHKPTPAIMADGASPSSQLTQRWPPGSPEG